MNCTIFTQQPSHSLVGGIVVWQNTLYSGNTLYWPHLLGVCPVPGVVAPRVIPGVTLETVDCVPSCKRRIFKVRNNIHHLLHLQSVEVDNMRPSLVATLVTVLHNTFTDYLAVKGKGESCQLNIRFASSIISSINILENRTLEFYCNSINKFFGVNAMERLYAVMQ